MCVGKVASSCSSSLQQKELFHLLKKGCFRLKDAAGCQTLSQTTHVGVRQPVTELPVACSRRGGVSSGYRKSTACSNITQAVVFNDVSHLSS